MSKFNLLNYLWDERIHGALESSLQQDEDFQKATRISNNAVGAEYETCREVIDTC